MLKETRKIKNGDYFIDYNIYSCDKCSKDIEEAWPFYIQEGKHYCIDCSFVLGIIGEKKYLDLCGGGLGWIKNIHAAVHEGKPCIWIGNTAPWEPTLKQLRASAEYRAWRKEVMKNGKGKCAICKSKEKLEAHHKKSFAKFPDLRFDVKNGQVLCAECHDKKHARKQKKKITRRKKVI